MRASWAITLLSWLVLTIPPPAAASTTDYLYRDETVCDADEQFCFRGTLTYHRNPRLLRLGGRLTRAPGPGLLRIRFVGSGLQGFRRYAWMEVRVEGHYSEILDHKMIPDHPDVETWEVDVLQFTPDAAESRN